VFFSKDTFVEIIGGKIFYIWNMYIIFD